jgi:hypothetical protein
MPKIIDVRVWPTNGFEFQVPLQKALQKYIVYMEDVYRATNIDVRMRPIDNGIVVYTTCDLTQDMKQMWKSAHE